MSVDPLESDYLAEGISRAVITRLAQVRLQVTPWETARRYTESTEPAERIARELNVDAALTGTFELVGDRIVTTLTLVEAESGLVTWAVEFEEPYADLFRMQRRIATGAATSLKRRLTGEPQRRDVILKAQVLSLVSQFLIIGLRYSWSGAAGLRLRCACDCGAILGRCWVEVGCGVSRDIWCVET